MTDPQRHTLSLARIVRRSSLAMVSRANASHIGSALSIADIVAVLYGDVMRTDPCDPQLRERDRFILSKGHACVAVYAALAALGFFSDDELLDYAKDGSVMMSHISHKVPGVEFSTGALGHGLPFGVGKALAAKKLGQDWRTFVLLSDGELDEGSNWEALMFAAHHRLDNLVAIVDYNKLQSLGSVEETLNLEPLVSKFKAFGCLVKEVDGHDHNSLREALCRTHDNSAKPLVVVAHTTKGKGVTFMENKVEWHYKAPSAEQLELALKELSLA